ncbi:formylglycine-generating enzyme family protein [Rubinisphaera sp.]|uniref:formylglycine-generating enzyme family protein n=1 Tax=Rubinisphaera sp. TaxID=2024857 RepID=UPI000C0DC850|nr:formylglycine-generating enzyme family protein [Rubinisphaera sp.]MBV11159.1 Sulphatase-modifying factor protein [Rubinisphaera sp.]HCS54080.1 formylglycine-generating enzyme family protein [Planctomycetaceae bacterium]
MRTFNKETASTLPEHLILPLSPEVSMEFRLIPPGRFRMGSRDGHSSEQPVHWVEITRSYYMGIFPVTQEQFAVWTEFEGIEHENRFPGNPLHPAENVDWNKACYFCEWLMCRQQSKIPEGYVSGLPSEAQWEHACRAGVVKEYYSGDGTVALSAVGWFGENSGDKTHPVGGKVANDFGLYDMHGNIYEWCSDTWDEFSYRKRVDGVRDPIVKSSELGRSELIAIRVIRGGSWVDSAEWCRAAFRFVRGPGDSDEFQGFRVCLYLGPCPGEPDSTGAESEPEPGDAVEVNQSESHFPSRGKGD